MKMNRHLLLLSTALAAWLAMADAAQGAGAKLAPLINMGIMPDARNGTVTVRSGETIDSIAKLYRLPVADIAALNHLDKPYHLAPGQRLLLPMPHEHKVGETDTLFSIGRMYNVPRKDIIDVNHLKPPYALRRGQVLRIPEKGTANASSSAPPVATSRPVSTAIETSSVSAAAPAQGHVRLLKKPGPSIFSTMVAKIAGPAKKADPFTPSPLFHPAVTPPPPPVVYESHRSGFVWPVRGQVISSYGPKDGGLYNDGINIAAPRGTPVVAAADGVIAYVGDTLQSYGNLVLIRHGGGMITAYAHLNSVNVKQGMTVRRGQPIGSVGSTGTVAHAQLHFEVRHGTDTVDPRQYLG
jgi:murein DD-endopeptidase MepM/ murein hydrolase activator NlpD